MKHAHKLEEVFQEKLKWNKARIKFFALFIIALITVRTVNLTEIALSINAFVLIESNYRRIQRFFSDFKVDFDLIAKLIVDIIPVKGPFTLSIDRTNWKIGKVNINILTLAIAYKGIAFPLLWSFLHKKGNSNTKERKEIIERFIKLFGVNKIKCLVGDREFIGKKWFAYLKRKKIIFYIRVKANAKISKERRIDFFFKKLEVNEYFIIPRKVNIYGHTLNVAGMRLEKEYLIIVTNDNPYTAIKIYKERWGIETLFQSLKSRGFNFEDTHLTKEERIKKLVAFLAISFAWAFIVGEWLNEIKPLKIKKHQRLEKSIFRYGLDHLRFILLHIQVKMAEFEEVLDILRLSLKEVRLNI
jgi:hypothetical protein